MTALPATTRRHALAASAWLALSCAAAGGVAAEQADSDPGCGHTIESLPIGVRSILGPYYTGAVPDTRLADAAERLRTLLRETDVCRLTVMSSRNAGATKQRDIMEWQSLSQWLTRLANFVGLNATGHDNVDWRDEYEIFAEVYELEI